MDNLNERLAGLIKQATEDRSHYYVRDTIIATLTELTRLQDRNSHVHSQPTGRRGNPMTDKLKEAIGGAIDTAESAWILQTGDALDGLQEELPTTLSIAIGQAALDAITAQGYAIVPVLPTEAMSDAGSYAFRKGNGIAPSLCNTVYRAMIAAHTADTD